MSEQRPRDAAPTDPRVLAAWRAASVEEPSARVDAAILAAAHAAVQDSTSARPATVSDPWWRRWQPLATAAAVTGLAFVLLQSLPREEPVPAPSVKPEARNEDRSPAPVTAPGPVAKARQESAVPEQADGGVASEAPVAADAASVAAERPAAPAAPAARATLQGLAGPQAADAWVARIVDRHAAGDIDAAAAELRAFRAAYPNADSRLPESLREWAATVTSPEAP